MPPNLSHVLKALSVRYHAVRVLGSGTYGVVYACDDLMTSTRVAIKVILPEADLPVPCMSEAAVIELRWTLAMHGNVNVIAFDRVLILTDFTVCFVMKVYDCTLSTVLHSKRLSVRHAQAAFIQMACGLHAMHGHGLCHRDLKPGNVLVDLQAGTVVLADLGMARDAINERCAFSPLTGSVITIGHAPVETLAYTCRYGTSVDIWSLGVILAELHLHRVAFKPCADRLVHASTIMSVLGVPNDHSRLFLNSVCAIPMATIALFPPKPHFINRLREKGASEAVVDIVLATLRYVPEDRMTIDEVLATDYVTSLRHESEECLSTLKDIFLPRYSESDPDELSVRCDCANPYRCKVALLLEYSMADYETESKTDCGSSDVTPPVWHLSKMPSSVHVGRYVAEALFYAAGTENMYWHCEAWLLGARFHAARTRLTGTKACNDLLNIAACVSLAISCTRPSNLAVLCCRFEWLRHIPIRIRGSVSFEDVAGEEVRILRDLGPVIPRTPLHAWQTALTELKTLKAIREYCVSFIT